MSQNHFMVELKIKINNYYTKNINQWHFLLPQNLMSQKVKFVVVIIRYNLVKLRSINL